MFLYLYIWFVINVSTFCPFISGRSEANPLFMVEESTTQDPNKQRLLFIPKLCLLLFTFHK